MTDTINPFIVRASLRGNSRLLKGTLPSGVKGAITNALDTHCGGGAQRKVVLAWLFDYDEPPLVEKSSKTLEEGQWLALNSWIDFMDGWMPCVKFQTEITFVLKAALSAEGASEDDYNSIPPKDHTARLAVTLGGKLKKEQ